MATIGDRIETTGPPALEPAARSTAYLLPRRRRGGRAVGFFPALRICRYKSALRMPVVIEIVMSSVAAVMPDHFSFPSARERSRARRLSTAHRDGNLPSFRCDQ